MSTPLISTIVLGLVLAFVFGTVAHRLKLSPIVGYLAAGILLGPFTPGFVADQHMAIELAELGVILLMFGVGLHFSWSDLTAVRPIALPGAVAQIALATLMGMALADYMGWSAGAGLVFGLALSVASTVVLIRALAENNITETEQGRIAVGWLIVEDLVMVVALLMLPLLAPALKDSTLSFTMPSLAEPGPIVTALAAMTLKLAAFAGILYYIGRRVLPLTLHYIARTGSRELFRLGVLAIALGVAYGAAKGFGVSFALGAFFAGMLLAGSTLGHRAAEETLPLRDAFAVLFFVAAGMMFDPQILVSHPLETLATFLIIVFGKSVAAFAIMRAAGADNGKSLTISASLAQIGEFSFILATLGLSLQLLPQEAHSLIVAGAILSIMINPILFSLIGKVSSWADMFEGTPCMERPPLPDVPEGEPLSRHAVVIGYENPSISVIRALISHGIPVYVLEGREVNLHIMASQMHHAIQEGFIRYGAESGANFTDAAALVLSTPFHQRAEALAARALHDNPDLMLIGYASTPEHEYWLHAQNARLIIQPETDQTSAAAQIADTIIDDGFIQAKNQTEHVNRAAVIKPKSK